MSTPEHPGQPWHHRYEIPLEGGRALTIYEDEGQLIVEKWGPVGGEGGTRSGYAVTLRGEIETALAREVWKRSPAGRGAAKTMDTKAWNLGLEARDAERRVARHDQWMAEKGFPPLGKEPAQVRVFRHDIQQWAEVPEERIAWGPESNTGSYRTELTYRNSGRAPVGSVPYLVEGKWAVRISFAPDLPSKEDIDQSQVDLSRWLRGIADEWDRKQDCASHERDSGNPIVTRAREIFLENVSGGEFTSVELRPHHEIAWCYGTRYGQAWKWPVYDAAYRWLTGMAEAVR